MNTVYDEEITMFLNGVNKITALEKFGFQTPSGVFQQSLKRVALRILNQSLN